MNRLLRPLRRSLRARLVAYFLLLSTITVLVVGAAVYQRATTDLTASVYDRLEAVAGIKADALERWITEQQRNIVFVGVLPGVGDDARDYLDDAVPAADRAAAEARLRTVLATVVAQTADAQEIYVADLDGTIRISTLAEHEGQSIAEQPFFETGSSHLAVQNAYRSPLTGRPTITVASPVFDANGGGRKVAVMAADLSLKRVDQIVRDDTGLGATGRAFLVGSDGRLIGDATATGEAEAVSSKAVDRLVAGESGEAVYTGADRAPVIGVYRWLETRNAGIVAEMTQDEAFVSARELALTIAVVGLFSAVMLAIGIWLVARRVTRPILALADTASRVQAGDLEATSGVRSEDEVGTLAVAFDAMTSELRGNVETLERRVVERTAEIGRQKQYFEALVEVSPVAIATMDREERVTAWNPAATSLFGYAPDEAIGQPIGDLILRSDELRAQGDGLAHRALDSGRAHLIAQRMRKDGSLLDAEIVMVPLLIDDEHIGYYAIYHDITELVAARRDADAANQAKSAFLAAMSHEIRTPMNAVIGMSGLLMDTPLDPEQRDFTETIHTSGEALLTIINDILDFSKIEAGRFELDNHPFQLASTIEGALDVMGPGAAKKGLELAYELDPELPSTVIGDAGRVRQIVLNMLSNAVKFTESGEVVVRVAGRALDGATRDDGRWELDVSVSDTGMGIPPDRIGSLFQSFTQADASIARRFGGTGLGLAISRRLAELMDGSMSAESAGVPGQGSTFRLRAHVTATASPAARSSAAAAFSLEGRRVLVVDDNATNLRILGAQLERLGVVVTATTSPLDAHKLASAAGSFDVVVSDLRMPDLDGLALAAAITSSGPAAPPVIVLSSLGERERDRPGVAAFLTKPVKPAALRDALMTILSGAAVVPQSSAPRGFAADPELGRRHPHRILVAEDTVFNQKLALKLLERMGYTADLAQDGTEAVDALERDDSYDLVLMDVQMPEMDGLEATRLIRARWPDRAVRILGVTASAMEGDREACLAAGMDDYLAKPIRPDELAAALAAAPSPAPVTEAS